MSQREPARSPAAAAASRRNGAASRGPTSAAGKATSSRNARKHGLFGADAVSGPISPTMVAVFEELAQGSSALAWQREVATVAALRLGRANALVRHLQAELAASVLDHSLSSGHVGELIGSLARMQRHARRFRGQRDRALRKALGRSPMSPSHPAELENAAPPEPT